MLRDASGHLVMTKGWRTFLILMAIVALVGIALLSTFLGISKMNEEKWKSKTEFSYESAYYTLADSLLNMENNLSKLRVTRSENLVNEMLIDVAMNSQTAVANLTLLSYGGYDLSKAIKYCNQVGDYSKYLAQDKLRRRDDRRGQKDFGRTLSVYVQTRQESWRSQREL